VAEIPSCSSRHKTGQVFMCDLNTVHEFLESVVQMSIWNKNKLLNAYLGMAPCLHWSATLFLNPVQWNKSSAGNISSNFSDNFLTFNCLSNFYIHYRKL
jgi:hypothetical protein